MFQASLEGARKEDDSYAAGTICTGLGWVALGRYENPTTSKRGVRRDHRSQALRHFEEARVAFDRREAAGHVVDSEHLFLGKADLLVGQSLALSARGQGVVDERLQLAAEAMVLERSPRTPSPLLTQVSARRAASDAVQCTAARRSAVLKPLAAATRLARRSKQSMPLACALLEEGKCLLRRFPKRRQEGIDKLREASGIFRALRLPNWVRRTIEAEGTPPEAGAREYRTEVEEAFENDDIIWDRANGHLVWSTRAYRIPKRGRLAFDHILNTWRYGRDRTLSGAEVWAASGWIPSSKTGTYGVGLSQLFRGKRTVWRSVVVKVDGTDRYTLCALSENHSSGD
ncbi:MAG: hypothetical protein IT349_09145 [Candidatus Eisenbacteria bacterium]|nr:hypothetical protein [Candidatus Eisenbacteria bacterium]